MARVGDGAPQPFEHFSAFANACKLAGDAGLVVLLLGLARVDAVRRFVVATLVARPRVRRGRRRGQERSPFRRSPGGDEPEECEHQGKNQHRGPLRMRRVNGANVVVRFHRAAP